MTGMSKTTNMESGFYKTLVIQKLKNCWKEELNPQNNQESPKVMKIKILRFNNAKKMLYKLKRIKDLFTIHRRMSGNLINLANLSSELRKSTLPSK